jgi:hypothetical protein
MVFISSFILFLSKVSTGALSFILPEFCVRKTQILRVCDRNIPSKTKQSNIEHDDKNIEQIFKIVF